MRKPADPTGRSRGIVFFSGVMNVRFLVTGGREILYAPEDGAAANEATPYLTGHAFGVVLGQRGMMMLHAATVKVGDCAVALCGPTGAGK